MKRRSPVRWWWSSFALPIALALAGCTGNLGDNGASGDGDGDGDGDGSGETSQPVCDDKQIGPSPMRRLTRWEYNNTVHDLLGDDSRPADRFEPETEQLGFDNNVEGATMSDVVVEQYEAAARELGAAAVVDLPALLGCDAASDGCIDAFLERFASRAFRRPLLDAERDVHRAFLSTNVGEYGASEGIALWISAVLQSPSFLHRVELGADEAADASGQVALDPYEVASRLSYLLWGSMPDDDLFEAAASGRLGTRDELLAQVDRMMEHEHGARAIRNFYGQWIGGANLGRIERGEAIGSTERALLREEVERFAEEVLLREDGTLADFFTSPRTFLNADLAAFYGIDGDFDETFREVELPADRHAGIFTKGATMALLAHSEQSSIVSRGKFIMGQVFCQTPPPPPCDVDTSLPAVDPDSTAREQLTQKTSGEACIGCHAFLNPPGFAFEHFDETGRYRDDDHGLPIDPSGELIATDVDGPFADQVGLAARLAESEAARRCMVRHWFHYTFGRAEVDGDACTIETATDAFEADGGNVRALLRSLVTSPSFTRRNAGGDP